MTRPERVRASLITCAQRGRHTVGLTERATRELYTGEPPKARML
jgi:hypothetical protein